MKTLLFFLLAFGSLYAQQPCAQDTAMDAVYLQFQMNQPPPACYPFACPVDSCHSIALPDSFSGVVELSSEDVWFQVVVLDQCRWVVHDTCSIITAQTPGFAYFRTFPTKSTILVCGEAGRAVSIFAKGSPSGLHPAFGGSILDLDTLCLPVVSVDQPQQTNHQHLWEFNGTHWQLVTAMKPIGMYKRWLFD